MLSVNRSNARSAIAVFGILALTFLLLPQPASAQFTTASLGGMVRDSSGAGIPDAGVNVLNVGTGFTQDLRTGANGAFLFSRLPIGTYVLRIEKQGFSTYVQDQIVLNVDQSANLPPITLQIGQVTDEVTVTGTSELVTTRTATGAQLVGEQQIVELPSPRTEAGAADVSGGRDRGPGTQRLHVSAARAATTPAKRRRA